MILQQEKQSELKTEIDASFDKLLSDSNIALSTNGRQELLSKVKSQIDYRYFPSGFQLCFEMLCFPLCCLRICMESCGFSISVSDQDSVELRGLSKSQLSSLSSRISLILEKYRDIKKEAELEQASKDAQAKYAAESTPPYTVTYTSTAYTPLYATAPPAPAAASASVASYSYLIQRFPRHS